jgi:hypothetical protein
VSGARFTFSEVRFPNEYNATIELVDIRQTHFWSAGSSALEALTTSSYDERNGGTATGVVVTLRLDTGTALFELSSDVEFDSNNDGFKNDSVSSAITFLRDLGLTE